MRNRLIILILILLALGAGAWYWQSGRTAQETKVLKTALLEKGTVRATLEATGIIKPEVGAIVKTGSRATGLIKKMYVRVGDTVKKGDLIAEIDDREQQASLAEAEATLRKAEAEQTRVETVYPLQINEARAQLKASQAEGEYLQLSLKRKKALVEQKLDSQDSLDDARQKHTVSQNTQKARAATLKRLETEYRLEAKKAREAVAAAQATLESVQVRITYTTIYAPIDGVVSQVAAQTGETVVAGFEVANLITILDPTRLEMWIYVDETDVGRIRSGMPVEFRVDAYPDHVFTGTVNQIYPEPEIRDNIVYYQALVRLAPETASQLRPEMTTQCTVVVQEKPDVLVLPNDALKWVDGEQFVFVKEADGSVRRTRPKLGLQGQTASEVLEGLSQGDEVAVKIILPTAAAKKKKP
ncbi:efflux RND transporter periplasmic adaptor subunit [Desulfovibrio subterraneus]|jgi:HlyD family secretion protein|uniref:RND transporter n=1 Tax=Desulfovibrio subterraneus TaxID=2718620 RepID=A0A7J0BGZ0_9BACT|nr:efflux RND transporter periplasmic adaptor subunit [Desulfovibrio subterraneus]GFM32956.1 RND transporter [Desulfovibrio subterraneus]